MDNRTHEDLVTEHLRQAWAVTRDASGYTLPIDREQHLTAALVYAVLAVNDTLCKIGEVVSWEPRQ